ncbi:hypothetical protein RhiirA4_513681 [Rhizophagus irregularis]|uniref:Uncharacterized protein n=1 Tax=Rhizophagus irregularis TaxID=588596 RepID=A0A2I1HIY6_9GLOM|nr:hypothetical protein RhiirA4_513681 [Rhizophagus irregularis]
MDGIKIEAENCVDEKNYVDDLESGNHTYGEKIDYVAVSPDGSIVVTFNLYGTSISIAKVATNDKAKIHFDINKSKKPSNILGWSLAVSNIIDTENDTCLIAISCVTNKDTNPKEIEKGGLRKLFQIYIKKQLSFCDSQIFLILLFILYYIFAIFSTNNSEFFFYLSFIVIPVYIALFYEYNNTRKILVTDIKQFRLSCTPSEGMIKLFRFSFNNNNDNNNSIIYHLGGVVTFLKNSSKDSATLICMNCVKIQKININLDKNISVSKEEPWNNNEKTIHGRFLNDDRKFLLLIGQNSIQLWKSKSVNFMDFNNFKNFKNSNLVYILISDKIKPETKVKFLIEDDITTVIIHACKSLVYLYNHKHVRSIEKYQKFVSGITNIIKDFIKRYPENWKLMEVQYPLMSYLICSHSFSLIKYILFGINGQTTEKLHKPQNNYASYAYYNDLELCDDLELNDTYLKSANDLTLALKFHQVCQGTLKVFVPLINLISTNSSDFFSYNKMREDILPDIYMVPFPNFTTRDTKIEGKSKKKGIVHFLRKTLFPPGYKNLEDKYLSPFLQINKSNEAFFTIPAIEAVINSRCSIILGIFVFSLCVMFYAGFIVAIGEDTNLILRSITTLTLWIELIYDGTNFIAQN